MADILDKDLVGIVGSIFATSPEAMKIARERADLSRAQAIANAEAQQMGGGSALNANIMGGQAVRQLGGLLGGEDPMMQRESAKRQLAAGLDMSKPEQVLEYAQRLADAGLQQESAQAIVGARAMQQQLANLGKTRAEEQAKLREPLPNIAKLQAYRAKAAEAGASPDQLAQIDAVIKAEGEGKGTKIVMPGDQQDKELRSARGKKFVELEDRAGIANSTLQVVSDFSGLIDKAFTGAASGAKLTAGQLANTLGVPVTGTTESEQLDQLFAALTLGQAKNLKGALSDKDVRFLKEAVGSRGLTAETLKSVVARIAREAEIDKRAYDKASAYYEGGGDIAKFNFAKTQEEATAEVNEKLAKQKRLNELKAKQSRPQ